MGAGWALLRRRRAVRNLRFEPKSPGTARNIGESPVGEGAQAAWASYPSSTGHVKPCANPGGPSPKAKYHGGPIVD